MVTDSFGNHLEVEAKRQSLKNALAETKLPSSFFKQSDPNNNQGAITLPLKDIDDSDDCSIKSDELCQNKVDVTNPFG